MELWKRYRPLASFQAKGIAWCYRVVRLDDREECLLRVLPPVMASGVGLALDEDDLKRFGNFSFPGMIDFYECGSYRDRVKASELGFLVERYYHPDESLQHHCGQREVPIEQLVGWFADLGKALYGLHAMDLEHGYQSPANVMLTDRGVEFVHPLAAKALEAVRERTSEDGLTLVQRFHPPEVLDGAMATPQSDIFSLGATLFFACTNRAPRLVRNPGERELWIPDLRSLRDDVPRQLVCVIAHAMAPDPLDRYPDARALSSDLGALAKGEKASIALRAVGHVVGAQISRGAPRPASERTQAIRRRGTKSGELGFSEEAAASAFRADGEPEGRRNRKNAAAGNRPYLIVAGAGFGVLLLALVVILALDPGGGGSPDEEGDDYPVSVIEGDRGPDEEGSGDLDSPPGDPGNPVPPDGAEGAEPAQGDGPETLANPILAKTNAPVLGARLGAGLETSAWPVPPEPNGGDPVDPDTAIREDPGGGGEEVEETDALVVPPPPEVPVAVWAIDLGGPGGVVDGRWYAGQDLATRLGLVIADPTGVRRRGPGKGGDPAERLGKAQVDSRNSGEALAISLPVDPGRYRVTVGFREGEKDWRHAAIPWQEGKESQIEKWKHICSKKKGDAGEWELPAIAVDDGALDFELRPDGDDRRAGISWLVVERLQAGGEAPPERGAEVSGEAWKASAIELRERWPPAICGEDGPPVFFASWRRDGDRPYARPLVEASERGWRGEGVEISADGADTGGGPAFAVVSDVRAVAYLHVPASGFYRLADLTLERLDGDGAASATVLGPDGVAVAVLDLAEGAARAVHPYPVEVGSLRRGDVVAVAIATTGDGVRVRPGWTLRRGVPPGESPASIRVSVEKVRSEDEGYEVTFDLDLDLDGAGLRSIEVHSGGRVVPNAFDEASGRLNWRCSEAGWHFVRLRLVDDDGNESWSVEQVVKVGDPEVRCLLLLSDDEQSKHDERLSSRLSEAEMVGRVRRESDVRADHLREFPVIFVSRKVDLGQLGVDLKSYPGVVVVVNRHHLKGLGLVGEGTGGTIGITKAKNNNQGDASNSIRWEWKETRTLQIYDKRGPMEWADFGKVRAAVFATVTGAADKACVAFVPLGTPIGPDEATAGPRFFFGGIHDAKNVRDEGWTMVTELLSEFGQKKL